jgi:hypothetical protein
VERTVCPGAFGAIITTSRSAARHDLAVVDVEPVRERERRALLDVRLDAFLVHGGDVLVRHQHHHDVGALHRVLDLGHLEPAFFALSHDAPSLAQADGDLDPESFRFCACAWPCEP